jgi:hypothetical protein
MTTVIEINHNSGPPVSDHWNNIIDTTPRLTITEASALGVSANGLNIASATGDAVAFGDQAISAPASNQINLRIRVNFDPLTVTGSQIFLTINIPSTFATEVLSIQVQAAAGVIQARANWQDDVPTLFSSAWVNISGETCLECSVIRNGVGVFKINSVTQHTTAALANAGQFDGMNFVLLTANAVTAGGTSGAFYLDEVLLDDSATSKLCSVFDVITHGRQSALLFNQQAAPTLDGQFAFCVVEDTVGAQVRYIKMEMPVKDDLSTPMIQVHTDSTDTDGMVTTTANADKMFFAGNDAVGGFVESHIVSLGNTTDLYSNASRSINAMTASPNLSSEALILESVALIEEIRHTIDDFTVTQVTNDLSSFMVFVTSSLAAIFSRTPEQASLRDMQAWLVGLDFSGSNQAAFFIQLMTGSGIVVTDEAIAALQAATLITGVSVAR